jgi:hypothetical protein
MSCWQLIVEIVYLKNKGNSSLSFRSGTLRVLVFMQKSFSFVRGYMRYYEMAGDMMGKNALVVINERRQKLWTSN